MLAAGGAEAYVWAMSIVARLGVRSAIILGLVLSTAFQAQAQSRLETFERDRLVIEKSGGERYGFEVELALTPKQQAQGLMFRRSLAADAGMLFVYDRDGPVGMWMKNTLIPLDMLFLARDGRVVQIVERTVPQSLQTISADKAVAAVLELNGGTAHRIGVAVGDRVVHRALNGGS